MVVLKHRFKLLSSSIYNNEQHDINVVISL